MIDVTFGSITNRPLLATIAEYMQAHPRPESEEHDE